MLYQVGHSSQNHVLLPAVYLAMFSLGASLVAGAFESMDIKERALSEKALSDFYATHKFTVLNVSSFIPEKSVPNVEEMNAVPEELHEDPFFQAYEDPISYQPIFNPVADRNEPKHIYEEETIRQWLANHKTSPLTMQPMTTDDLIPLPDLKEKINKKINDYLQLQQLQNQHEKNLQNLPEFVRVHLIAARHFGKQMCQSS